MANRHTGFCKHFICEETLSRSDSPTLDQDISRIKYTRGANFTKLCRRHRETSTTNDKSFCQSSSRTFIIGTTHFVRSVPVSKCYTRYKSSLCFTCPLSAYKKLAPSTNCEKRKKRNKGSGSEICNKKN